MDQSAPSVTRPELAALLLILASALALRLPAIGWGLPPTIPHVVASDIRSSYSFDEDDILTSASFTQPAKLDFDVHMYHWGTLHLEITAVWLELVQAVGMFRGPWREAYYQMVPGFFERVYMAGRMLSILTGLLSIILVYLLGREIENRSTALWAAAVLAVSPVHLLGSTQIRVDMTMMALLTLTAWLGARAQKHWQPWRLIALGFVGGLAVTAKYPAIFAVLPILAAVVATSRFRFRATAFISMGTITGCMVGQPYLLTRFPAMVQQIQPHLVAQTPTQFKLSAIELLWLSFINTARFLIGPVALGAVVAGIWKLVRRHDPADWLVLTGLAGMIVSLIPLRWPLLRYLIPLLPFLAVAAGIAIATFGQGWQWLAGCAVLVFPVCASLAQLHYMTSSHPANQILHVILDTVPPGTTVSRLIRELPPLDCKIYPMGPNPFFADLTQDPPAWVLTADLPTQEYPAATQALLKNSYEKIAEARISRILAWATFGESGAPHDWKYTHPWMALYRRRW